MCGQKLSGTQKQVGAQIISDLGPDGAAGGNRTHDLSLTKDALDFDLRLIG